jgi:hypothetical protein
MRMQQPQPQKKIADAPGAEGAVREALQSQYGKNMKGLTFKKCWYSSAGRQEFWDVEGTFIHKLGIMGREVKSFRYQVDPDSGRVIGYEVMDQAPRVEKQKRGSDSKD